MLVSARGVRINAIDRGAGDPVVFLHGIGGDAGNWAPQLEALAATHRVVALDSRGFGRSDRTYGRMSLADYARDVLVVMTELGIGRAPIVGLSMGGMIAQTVALTAPQRVASLVLADTSSSADADMKADLTASGAAAVAHGMPAVATAFMPATFSRAAVAENRRYVRDFEENFSSTDPLTFNIGLQAIAELDLTDELHRIDVPTLVLVGDEDALTPPEHSKTIASTVPGAELVVIDDAGHLSNLDQAGAFTEHLVRFLDAA
ncbi:alpha/beta fold hydrolase [Geodermatophilus sp. TF02-6]|uniref:alpha/beta fold hydrolase n=1 Tax=Geodermatophilus sp. TF02-6 TaxID=2250575 RepID=UPI00131467AE|nr:alpha/beta fold hydrolase [Geodermatophilus sp. TF02-6]